MTPTHRRLTRPLTSFVRSKKAVAAIEFALIGPIFIAMIVFILEFSLDLVWQSSLDTALDLAARKIQTGSAKTATNGANFVSTYVCPNLLGVVSCGNVYVRVQRISPTGQQDFYDFTTVEVPHSGSTLDLSTYASSSFCNAGPTEMLVVSAIFVAPTFVSGLLPASSTFTYNGLPIHAVFSSVALETEGYWTPAVGGGVAAAC